VTATVVDAGDGLALTVPALLRERVAGREDKPLLICDDDVLTYGEAAARSARLATGLLAAGAGPRSHIGLLHPNGAAFVTGWLAAARIGAVTVPLSTFSTSPELRTLLQKADIETLLSTRSFRGRDYVEALHDAIPEVELASSSPLHEPSVPALRRVLFDTAALPDADDNDLAGVEDAVQPSSPDPGDAIENV